MIIILARTVIIYVTLIIFMRLMGKRQIGELEISDLVTTFLISELASLPISDNSIPLTHAVVPIIILVTLEVASSCLLVRFPSIKSIFSARPSVLINKGHLDRHAMMSARISVDELISELRQNGITSISEVEYAILEQTGKITVIEKAEYKPVNAKQMKIKTKESGISHVIICEGKINKNSLGILGLSKTDVMRELERKKLSLSDVYIMTADDLYKFEIIKKEG